MKKYEFTDETITVLGVTLHRIKALVDFSNVIAGDLGGFIEKESNLDHRGDAWVAGDAWVGGNARVAGDAWVGGNAMVAGDARVCDSARVAGDAWVGGNARVAGDARINKTNDYIVIGPIGSRSGYTTFYKDKNNNISVTCGCFIGAIDKFLDAVNETHGNNKHAKIYKAAVELAKIQIER